MINYSASDCCFLKSVSTRPYSMYTILSHQRESIDLILSLSGWSWSLSARWCCNHQPNLRKVGSFFCRLGITDDLQCMYRRSWQTIKNKLTVFWRKINSYLMPVKLCCLSLKRKHCQCEVISYWLQQTKSYKTLPLNSITADRNCANKLYRRCCKLPFNKFISLILLGKHPLFFFFSASTETFQRRFQGSGTTVKPYLTHSHHLNSTSPMNREGSWMHHQQWGLRYQNLLVFFSSTYSHNHKKVFSFFQSLIYSGLLPSLCFTTPCLNNQVPEK